MNRYTRFPSSVLLILALALALGVAWPKETMRAPMPAPRPELHP